MKFFNNIKNNEEIKEFIRFVIIGVIATAIHYSIYFALYKSKVQYNISYTLGYGISFLFNFFASNYFTFKTKPNTERGIGFIFAHGFNYLLQMFLLNIFIYVGVSSVLAPIFIFAICIPTNFFIVRFVLKHKYLDRLNFGNTSLKIYFFSGFILGVILFIKLYGIKVLDFTNTDWLMNSGDLSQHFLGWEFFRDSRWTIPIGIIENLAYPFGVAITYMDSIPLFAIMFKILNPILPNNFQYFGLFGILSFGLQGSFAAIIFRKYFKNLWLSLIGSVFIILNPIMLRRMFVHTALAAHWIILCSIAVWVYRDYFKTLKSRTIIWCTINILGILIHPYFIPMIMVIMLGVLIDDFVKNKNIKEQIIIIMCSFVSIVLTFLIIGGFSGESYESIGLGFFSMNLNALINPIGWSKYFLKDLPLATEGQYEGFQYIGFGLILMLPIAIYLIASKYSSLQSFNKKSFKMMIKKYSSIMLAFIILLLLSTSNSITLNNKVLIFYKIPKLVESLWSIFRSTGRLFWPVNYAISLALIIFMVRNIKSKISAALILSLFLILQVFDMKHILREKNDYYKSDIKFETTLKSGFWKDAGKVFKNIVILPANSATFGYFGKYASQYNMNLSTGYFARGPYTKIDEYSKKSIQDLKEGKIDEDTLYIIMEYYVLTDIMINSPPKAYSAGKVDLYTVLYKNKEIDLKNYADVSPYEYNQFQRLTFDDYLDELLNLKDGIAAIYAVKDEAFKALTEKQIEKMKLLGMLQDNNIKEGWSLAGVIVNGHTKFKKEISGMDSARMSFTKGQSLAGYTIKSDIQILSLGIYNNNPVDKNYSYIFFNNLLHSLNQNGINIVLYDINNDRVLETAAFYTHFTNEGCILRWK